jgi:hypothetical protein
VYSRKISHFWYLLVISHIRTNNKAPANSMSKEVRFGATFHPFANRSAQDAAPGSIRPNLFDDNLI